MTTGERGRTDGEYFGASNGFSGRVVALGMFACVGSFACAGGSAVGVGGDGGGAPAGAGGAAAAVTGGAGTSGVAGAPAACVRDLIARRTAGAIVALQIAPILGGAPFVFGEANTLPGGETVTPTDFRFYVSDVTLTTGGVAVPVDLVTTDGAVEPYGIHLYDAEEAGSATLRVRAPAGSYDGALFTLGIDDACNGGDPSLRSPPLSPTSQLTWPHTVGYLFLRFEAQLGGNAGASVPAVIHMGGQPGRLLAPVVPIAVPASEPLVVTASAAAARTLTLSMDELFVGAEVEVDPSSFNGLFPGPEVQAGERLRQSSPHLPLFALGPAPAP
jgi:hypothetical protein